MSVAPASTFEPRRSPRQRRPWVPALMVASCVLGAVLQLVVGLPGIPVWIGVLLAETLVLVADRSIPRRQAGAPAPEPAQATPPRRPARAAGTPPVGPGPEPPSDGEPQFDVDGPAVPIQPPDVRRPWTAEIQWRERSGRAQFLVVASSDGDRVVALARSRTLTWPPSGAEEIGDLTGAVDELAAALLAAGWVAAEHGSAWYARRFTWSTDSSRRSAAIARLTVPAPPPERRSEAWPAGTEQLPRCEIEWQAGYRRSYFRAVVSRPGDKRGAPIGASQPFKWMVMNPPTWRDPDQFAAVKRLRAELREQGWDEVEPGPAWYARRFVWRAAGEPPARL